MGRLGALLLLVLLVSCSAPSPHRLRVATDPHHPPLSFLDDAKQLRGYEIDLARALAAQGGWELELLQEPTNAFLKGVEGDGILQGLTQGDYEAVLSSVSASNRLRSDWSLSQPYLNAGPVLVLRAEGTGVLNASWTGGLGVLEYTPGAEVVQKTSVLRWWWRPYFDPVSALEDLGDQYLTGVVAGLPEVAAVRYDNDLLRSQLKVATEPLTQDELYVVVVKKDSELLTRVNQALQALEANGTMDELKRKWLLK